MNSFLQCFQKILRCSSLPVHTHSHTHIHTYTHIIYQMSLTSLHLMLTVEPPKAISWAELVSKASCSPDDSTDMSSKPAPASRSQPLPTKPRHARRYVSGLTRFWLTLMLGCIKRNQSCIKRNQVSRVSRHKTQGWEVVGLNSTLGE